jgi:hypothetical protein
VTGDAINDEPAVQSRPCLDSLPCAGLPVWYKRERDAAKEIDRLAKTYRAAPTEVKRRAVCLDAIDGGVIARGRSVAVVDAIFGTTYTRKLPRRSQLETGVVDFHSRLLSGRDTVASGYIGWYLAFEFDSTGRLQNYSLSNLHK